jgi:bifunctional non-homologous end joining protein LigD
MAKAARRSPATKRIAASKTAKKTSKATKGRHGVAAAGAERLDALLAYKDKRDFGATPEPKGKVAKEEGNRFCVQKHDARRLHYDLRLELEGVLKSWAVTRGPSLVPGEKRLAVHTEDHPLEYLAFEGVIPQGEYGGGTMIVWDQGRWAPLADPHKGYAKGHLDFSLEGERLKGRWHLVRMRPRPREKKEQWLLLKGDDEHARRGDEPEITDEVMTSVISGRTNDDLARSGEVREDHAARGESAKGKPRPKLSHIPGARKGLLPSFLEPSLASPTSTPPNGRDWIHEIKFDGYRLQARIDGGKVKLLTRKGLDWSEKFRPIMEGLKALKLGSALLDGEVVVEDAAGISSFSNLQADLSAGRTDRMVYYAFDLLYLDGYELTKTRLVDRKTLLAGLLDAASAGAVIRISEHIDHDGEAMLRHACRLGLEGIISKRRDQPYRPGRGHHWLKAKCTQRQNFVICGYVPSTTSRKAVGSLILGVYEHRKLQHVGRVGTSFTEVVARNLAASLDEIKRSDPPFSTKLPKEAGYGARWVEPKLVAEVELMGWTADGLVRHASFKGLREDIESSEIVREEAAADPPPAPTPRFELTHPDRVFWPDVGITKQGLAAFYSEIADWVLPHVIGRPLSLVRCPTGVGNECFFQKHAWTGMGKAVRRRKIPGEEVLYIEDLDGLIALVQSGVLEIHPWGSRIASVEQPDRVTIDLDPAEDVAWTTLIEAALEVRERLRARGLESFVKTTGGKGLHVVFPLTPKAQWDEVKAFAQQIAEEMAKDSPARYVATMAKRVRTGRIFVDYLRNGRGATAIAAYSTRARAGAAVSTPLEWEELSPSLRPNHFTADNLPTRLRHLGRDPWTDMAQMDQGLPSGGRPQATKAAIRSRKP